MAAERLATKIFLIGFMGAGKTTLGRLLAERIGWEFLDIDTMIEQSEGSSVVRVFVEKGEAHFRAIEKGVLARAAASPSRAVVACGGGTFCDPDNMRLMTIGGVTVWVDQPFDRIWERREDLSRVRPLLRGEAEMRALYLERLPDYSRAALHLPVADGNLARALEELLRLLGERIDMSGAGG
jgi:shikimate kinase